ncbi:MAG: hypothetical protein KC503_05300 [Myxococcales bacterium]|nr:hypothetical protein [Myxococcales bacterium]
MSDEKRSGALEAAVVVPNLVLLALIVLYLVFARGSGPRVQSLVKTDVRTAKTIKKLEETLRRNPSHIESAIRLAKLYMRAGEYPWSIDALRSAERHGSSDAAWRMKLGLAYLELGKNLDGLRVLKGALLACAKVKCRADIEAKLRIFTRVATILQRKGINAHKDQVAAAKVFGSVLKPVQPDRLSRLKAAAAEALKKAADDKKKAAAAATGSGSGSALASGSGSGSAGTTHAAGSAASKPASKQ